MDVDTDEPDAAAGAGDPQDGGRLRGVLRGNCYLNFHSTQNPGGEIRINLCPQGDGRVGNPFFAINVCIPDK